jgi:propionate CoA-transferase
VVVAPDQKQTTATEYDPAISGEIIRPLDSFLFPQYRSSMWQKVIARRVAQELKSGMGGQSRLRHLGQCAAHPSRENLHGEVSPG